MHTGSRAHTTSRLGGTRGGRAAALGLAAVVVAASLAACTGGGQGNSSSAVLTTTPNVTGPFTDAFNPYLPTSGAASGFAGNLIYEPLMMPDFAHATDKPWLATGTKWSDGGRSLTITLRGGVKWSDGKPFSASDVAYTFNLLKKYPALNDDGLPITSATAPNGTTAVVKFTRPAYTYQQSIDSTKQVPQHVWQKVGNPSTFRDPKPVGTGPYLLSQFTPQSMTFIKNPKFWQADKVRVQTMRYDSFESASSIEAAMESGQLDWEDHVFPDFSRQLLSRPNISGQNATNGIASIIPNTAKYPLNLVAVRKAISAAIDRTALTAAENTGQQPVTTPTGLTGGLSRYRIPAYKSLRYSGADPAAAKALLTKAGFTMGSDGIFITPKGSPLKLTMLLGSGQENLVTMSQTMVQELKKAGIGLHVKTEIISAVGSDVNTGKFDLNVGGMNGQFSPYMFYRTFDPEYFTPIGKRTQGDEAHYNDATAKKAFSTLANSAPGSTAAQQATAAIEKIMVEQMPVIPLNTSASQWAFRTDKFTGWPTKSNPYAFATVLGSNVELIMTHLRPKK